jgi:hypothetical protein
MPRGQAGGGVPGTNALPKVRAFSSSLPTPMRWQLFSITGITKDSAGAALGNCVIKLFRTSDDLESYSTVSDASGNYILPVDNLTQWYAVAYKAGSPDVAGTTVNTLIGA